MPQFSIALITDSACDLPPTLLEALQIHVLPFGINYQDGQFLDRVDIQPEDIYARLPVEIPTTSMPTPGAVLALLDQLKAEGYKQVLAIHISSSLSGTWQMVQTIASQYEGLDIRVFDSRSLSFGQGFLLLEAARMLRSGQTDLDTIWQRLVHLRDTSRVFFILDTLEYLHRGGRIGAVSAFLGQMLNLKPIISVDKEGKYFSFTKVRGKKLGLKELLKIGEQLAKETPCRLAVLHGAAEAEARELYKKLKELPTVVESFLEQISPALGIHTGPGLVGFVFCEA
ncbi:MULTISPECIES: DegV family protein [Carboxydocella]|uniref:EDD domain protein, DegV family n=2 Tax=Carboxydocella TaxID=178898 RepID=A0A1T4QPE1_9FIRM|nr:MULTISPECIES: DegV family protein [Carboxydocella]AVX21544.1 EDD domain protein, DegV family [Carboxydocella thermautotrophica]AVX32025.1 EDD domain protein, DegV family [Carboxydocella thermautotrophica]SKA05630.1 EDD domain protein, DegV family [Carboxydocella sporoproducens DSM 16521]GAW27743.1 fatty acid-binding protein DegV [Carboxydocella sp. ULO1]GAW31935.1 fatty acid-binding protein DegV [Carboxydocella sp. JDF658]